jgi:tetratricopeptide (TPR) repeat protein
VSYTGDGGGGRVLEVRFSREVSFEVVQQDLRSLVVTVLADARPRAPGPPAAAQAVAPPPPPSRPPSLPKPPAPPAPSVERSPAHAPEPPPLELEGPFAVQLHAAPSSEPLPPAPSLEVLARHRLYTVPLEKNGVRWTRLRLGFFVTPEQADAARQELGAAFPGAWVSEVSARERALSEETALARPALPVPRAPERPGVEAVEPPAAADEAPSAPGATTPPRTSEAPLIASSRSADRVEFLVQEGRAALAAGDLDRAAALFTQVLSFPEHALTPDVLELLGLARERKGQLAHAQAEYETYLERYPEAEGAERVQQRLGALLTATSAPRAKLRETREDRGARPDLYGSVGTFYRRDSRLPHGSGEEEDFSSQIFDLSLGARGRAGDWDLRGEAAGTYRHDFLDDDSDWHSGVEHGRVRSLFVDFADRAGPLSGRIGRQWSSSGGVLGTFDGGRLAWRFPGPWKVTAVAGFPVETFLENDLDTDRNFYGLSFGVEAFQERLDAELFGIRQMADGETDRIGVGGEARYFWDGAFVAGLVDYDPWFDDLTTAQLLGDWEVVPSTHLNLLLDYRQSPIPETANALLGEPVDSLDDLGLSEDEMRELAEDRSARTQLATLGATHRLSDRFQLAADLSASEYGETESSGNIVGFEGTGLVWAYSTQLVASQLLGDSDVQTLGVRYVDAQELDAIALLLHGYYPLARGFRLKPMVILLRRRPSGEDEIFTVRPGAGFDVPLGRLTFDAGGTFEWSNRETAIGAGDDRRYTLEVGVRYDF